MKKVLGFVFMVLLLVGQAGATQTSWYHIPANAWRGEVPSFNHTLNSQGAIGCFNDVEGPSNKTVMRCSAPPGFDAGMYTDLFVLPPFALSSTIYVKVIFDSPGGSAVATGFYGFFETTPPLSIWGNNLADDCPASAEVFSAVVGPNLDNFVTVPVQACDQFSSSFCGANIAACAGYHGRLVIFKSGFEPSGTPNISDVFVGVITP